MTRISDCFKQLAATKRTALISYITAGDPHPKHTLELMHALVEGGTDLIELGIPFSDPMADGPVIQAACERALQHDTSLEDVLHIVEQFRKDNNTTPIIFMGYQNPFEIYGVNAFAKAASNLVDGIITVDLPPEESSDIAVAYKQHNIDTIYLLAPTTNGHRIQTIASLASGFLYYVSFKGITGANKLDVDSVATKVSQIRDYSALPVAVGFGIKDAVSAKSVASCADAVVVGSAIVSIIAEHADNINVAKDKIKALLSSIKLALDDNQATQKIA